MAQPGKDSVIGWLLNLIYALLIATASPILLWRMVTQGKYRCGWGEKLLGQLPETGNHEEVLWLHAVSVGEVLQLRTIIPRIRSRRPRHTVLITTTTLTGHAVACETFPECRVAYLPLDFTWAVRTALRRVRPVFIGLVELELWPNLIRETAAAGVPLMLINGRISERSFRGYQRLRFFVRPLLRRFDALTVQTNEYAARVKELGAPADLVSVTGSLKFDGVRIDRQSAQTATLRMAFGICEKERVLIAGSTHDPEETIALDAWQQLRRQFPDLRLILVPRHQERFETVAASVTSRGLPLIRRSRPVLVHEGSTHRHDSAEWRETLYPPVCLLDTLGELSACWGLADVAFVGGSLTRRGGQNMIEPAGGGIPVIVGPNTSNFQDVVEGLRAVGGISVISGGADLTRAVRHLLTDTKAAMRQGEAARTHVLAQQGAADRTLEIIERLLSLRSARQSRQAA